MASKYLFSRWWRRLTGLLPLFVASGVFAAPGFIAGSRITGDASFAEITLELACAVQYVDHMPAVSGARLRIHFQPTTVCVGVSPSVARSRQQYRPLDADKANLIEVFYEGNTAGVAMLTLVFDNPVRYEVVSQGTSNDVIVRVQLSATAETTPKAVSGNVGVRVQRQPEPEPAYLINLSSSRRPHAPSDIPNLDLQPGTKLFESEVYVAGVPWYRLRLGPFKSSSEARAALDDLHEQFPTAWLARESDSTSVATSDSVSDIVPTPYVSNNSALASIGLDQVDVLMSDARRAMVAGEVSRAVQIYTKVLQIPNHDRHPEALEYLALAREKNGQTAHAKAEYQRYLSIYPDGEGAMRVSQRLAVLVAIDRPGNTTVDATAGSTSRRQSTASDWRFQTFFSQFYRRDANQQNGQEEIISQSALYSDMNFDARRRGERFDIASRLSLGYRNEFLDDRQGSGNALRVTYAYVDLADAKTDLRGRVGRQSRNTGGVLGRFDGLNLGYQISERILLSTVVGKPVFSTSNSDDIDRSFYGASINYGPILENLDIGAFYIEQKIEGVQDRQAVGAEFRYFGTNQSLWGTIDYDISYKEIASAFLQASWRFESRLSIHGVADRRGSPFRSTGNAMIGQPVASFAELAVIFSEDELRQLSLDRTAVSTTYTVGISYPLTPKLQINVDASQSEITDTPASGGVLGTPGMTYNYYSGTLVASSLLKEGDVSIFSLRYSDSDTTKVVAVTLDSRFPIGSKWRINPRLRVDRRESVRSSTYEWLYTPGLRINYRLTRKMRFDLEIGKQFSQRETPIVNLDRESYFFNIGYQVFF